MIYSLLITTSHEDLIVRELPLLKNVNFNTNPTETVGPKRNLNKLVRLHNKKTNISLKTHIIAEKFINDIYWLSKLETFRRFRFGALTKNLGNDIIGVV